MKRKSFSKRKQKIDYNEITELGTKYLLNWTKKELRHFTDKPVVIPIGDYGFLIGFFRIKGKAKSCWLVENYDGQFVHNFTTKTNAILYCLYEMSNKYLQAKELLELDAKLGKLENDLLQYDYIINSSKDKLKSAVALNRYIETKSSQRIHNDILKKTLKSAKYLKFGNSLS